MRYAELKPKGTLTACTECSTCGPNSRCSMEFPSANGTGPHHLWIAFPCPVCGGLALLHMQLDLRDHHQPESTASQDT